MLLQACVRVRGERDARNIAGTSLPIAHFLFCRRGACGTPLTVLLRVCLCAVNVTCELGPAGWMRTALGLCGRLPPCVCARAAAASACVPAMNELLVRYAVREMLDCCPPLPQGLQHRHPHRGRVLCKVPRRQVQELPGNRRCHCQCARPFPCFLVVEL